MWHDSFINVTWLIDTRDITHSYESHDSFIHMWDMTRSYVWHVFSTCVTWLIDKCDMTHSYEWQNSFVCVTGLLDVRDMTHWYVWHLSFTWEHDACIWVTWHIPTCDMARSYEYPDPFKYEAYRTHMGDMVCATRCNTLQHNATHWNTLQRATTHCNTPQHTATHY